MRARRHHQPPPPSLPTPPYTPVKLAASVGEGTQTKAEVDAFNAQIAPRKLDRLMFFTAFEGQMLREEFTRLMIETGMEEMILAWLPSNIANTVSCVAEIAEGKKDAYIKTAFEEMKAWNKPIILRYAHEFNGNWQVFGCQFGTKSEAVGENKKGETAAVFIEAWKRVVAIREEVGCPKVKIAFNPNAWGGPSQQDPSSYYPGDAYVEYVGLDNYMRNGIVTRPPAELFTKFKQLAALAPTKPLCIFETGCCANGEETDGLLNKAAWFNQLAYMIAHEFKVVHMGYWNRHKEAEPQYKIDSGGTDLEAAATFRAMVNYPVFV